jgi:hypothetical protein
MAEAWPDGVPHCFTADSLAVGLADGRIRSQTDTGPGKVRRRSSAMVKDMTGTLIMTYAQLTALETFVDDTLLGGSLPFSFPDQRGNTILVRFADKLPSWSRYGMGYVSVDMSLEILPGGPIPAVDLPVGALDFSDPDRSSAIVILMD